MYIFCVIYLCFLYPSIPIITFIPLRYPSSFSLISFSYFPHSLSMIYLSYYHLYMSHFIYPFFICFLPGICPWHHLSFFHPSSVVRIAHDLVVVMMRTRVCYNVELAGHECDRFSFFLFSSFYFPRVDGFVAFYIFCINSMYPLSLFFFLRLS